MYKIVNIMNECINLFNFLIYLSISLCIDKCYVCKDFVTFIKG